MIYLKLLAKCVLLLNIFIKVKCVEKREPPSKTEVIANFKTNLTLPCESAAREEGDIVRWVRKGKNSWSVLDNGDLFLVNLEKNDSGEYMCLEQDNDEILSTYVVHVKTPPAALENVTVIPRTVLAVLRWHVRDDGGYSIKNITIRYKLADSDDEWHINPHYISSTATQTDIYKLNPNSTYMFQIWASNELGAGEITTVLAKTRHDIQEIELARHLLDGAETFDTRAWLAAVAIVMTTLLILTIGTCCVLYRDSHAAFYHNEEYDPERIELMPNVITNPGYYEEFVPAKYCNESPDDEDEFTSYFASRTGARAVRV
ncbi:uncharacterized protein LOC135837457 [Planococcus citri]|uniref:uncharacterized protein LOC135837457 n=1 Tax=Planococcus citri TaxID=170843 RepID=UPI0031F869D9